MSCRGAQAAIRQAACTRHHTCPPPHSSCRRRRALCCRFDFYSCYADWPFTSLFRERALAALLDFDWCYPELLASSCPRCCLLEGRGAANAATYQAWCSCMTSCWTAWSSTTGTNRENRPSAETADPPFDVAWIRSRCFGLPREQYLVNATLQTSATSASISSSSLNRLWLNWVDPRARDFHSNSYWYRLSTSVMIPCLCCQGSGCSGCFGCPERTRCIYHCVQWRHRLPIPRHFDFLGSHNPWLTCILVRSFRWNIDGPTYHWKNCVQITGCFLGLMISSLINCTFCQIALCRPFLSSFLEDPSQYCPAIFSLLCVFRIRTGFCTLKRMLSIGRFCKLWMHPWFCRSWVNLVLHHQCRVYLRAAFSRDVPLWAIQGITILLSWVLWIALPSEFQGCILEAILFHFWVYIWFLCSLDQICWDSSKIM